MSMLASQCDELRDRARGLRMFASGLSAPYIVPSTKETMALAMSTAASRMDEAADTIEGLRDRLAADPAGGDAGWNDYEVRVWGTADRMVDVALRGSLQYSRSRQGCGMQCEADEGSPAHLRVMELCDRLREAALALDDCLRGMGA